MSVMEANVQGWWRPSPGSIYPMLQKMKDEGVLSETNKKYRLTEKGREEVDHPFPWLGGGPQAPRSVEGVLQELSSYVSYLEDIAESDQSKLDDSVGQIKELGNRLAKLGGST